MIRATLAVTLALASSVYAHQESNVVMWGDEDVIPEWRTPPAGIQMIKVASGQLFCLGIDTQGELHAWGRP